MARRNPRRNTRRNPYDRDKDLNAAEVVVFYILQSLDYDHPWAARPILIDAMNEIERDAEYKRAKIKPAYESAYRALNSALEILNSRYLDHLNPDDDDDYDDDDYDYHHGSGDGYGPAMEQEMERVRREIMEEARKRGYPV